MPNEIREIFDIELEQLEGALVPDMEKIELVTQLREAVLAKIAEYCESDDDRETIQPGDARYYHPEF